MRIDTRLLTIAARTGIASACVLLSIAPISCVSGVDVSCGPDVIVFAWGGAFGAVWSKAGAEDEYGLTDATSGKYAGPVDAAIWMPERIDTTFSTAVLVPLWLPAACSLAIGVPAFVTLRRRARALKNGACIKCGYVLTGLSPAAPCTECGRAQA